MMRGVLIVALLAVTLGVLPSCVNSAEAADDTSAAGREEPARQVSAKTPAVGDDQQERRRVNVRVEPVTPGALTEYVKANGVTVAESDITYSAEIAGRVEHLKVELGQEVKRGKVLARIDFASISAQAEQAEATLDLAKKTHDRLAQLADEKLVSQQRLDEARSRMIQAEAALKIVRANLAKSTIRAQRSGVITEKRIDKGEYVGPGTPMFRVVDHSHIIVEAKLAETQVAKVSKGQPVRVLVDALGRHFGGKVESVIPTADPISKTFTVRIGVDNPDADILVGMAATVSVASAVHENVVIATQDAVVEQGDSKSVFVVEGDRAVKRRVELGATEGDKVILLSGLRPGEQLVVLGQRELVDAQPVRVVR